MVIKIKKKKNLKKEKKVFGKLKQIKEIKNIKKKRKRKINKFGAVAVRGKKDKKRNVYSKNNIQASPGTNQILHFSDKHPRQVEPPHGIYPSRHPKTNLLLKHELHVRTRPKSKSYQKHVHFWV